MVNKYFIDTNVWVRFFVRDDEKQTDLVDKWLKLVEQGEFAIVTSSIVMIEVAYVLQSVYKIDKKTVMSALDGILSVRGIKIIDKTDIVNSIKLAKKTNLKLSDCLIATQVRKGMILVTFDNDFRKVSDLKVLSVAQILNTDMS